MKVYGPHNVDETENILVQITLYSYNSEFYNAVIGLHVISIKKRSNMLRIIVFTSCIMATSETKKEMGE